MLRYRIALRHPAGVGKPAARRWEPPLVVGKLPWLGSGSPGAGKAFGGMLDKQSDNYLIDPTLIVEK
jgi:hypothetical protein